MSRSSDCRCLKARRSVGREDGPREQTTRDLAHERELLIEQWQLDATEVFMQLGLRGRVNMLPHDHGNTFCKVDHIGHFSSSQGPTGGSAVWRACWRLTFVPRIGHKTSATSFAYTGKTTMRSPAQSADESAWQPRGGRWAQLRNSGSVREVPCTVCGYLARGSLGVLSTRMLSGT